MRLHVAVHVEGGVGASHAEWCLLTEGSICFVFLSQICAFPLTFLVVCYCHVCGHNCQFCLGTANSQREAKQRSRNKKRGMNLHWQALGTRSYFQIMSSFVLPIKKPCGRSRLRGGNLNQLKEES